jgi:7-carboxy-7-deazaguanine synthase
MSDHFGQNEYLTVETSGSSSHHVEVHHTIDLDLRVTEIYASVQGESSYAGYPCTFIRLTGCPLRCRWCDTAYGFEGGSRVTLSAILDQVSAFGIPLVELTGGEPLAQKDAIVLVRELHRRGFKVLIETGGSEAIADYRDFAHIIMDLKCPGSGMSDRMLWENLEHLKASDEIKFVLASREDFDWAKTVIKESQLDQRFRVLLSCAFGLLKPAELVSWMVKELPLCRLNLQQHKYIWNPRAKGV